MKRDTNSKTQIFVASEAPFCRTNMLNIINSEAKAAMSKSSMRLPLINVLFMEEETSPNPQSSGSCYRKQGEEKGSPNTYDQLRQIDLGPAEIFGGKILHGSVSEFTSYKKGKEDSHKNRSITCKL